MAPYLTIGTEDPKPNTGPVEEGAEEGAGGGAKAVVEVELLSIEAYALLPEAMI